MLLEFMSNMCSPQVIQIQDSKIEKEALQNNTLV